MSLDTREWLLTNGLGGFASGTICDAHTRTYHGWLIAALNPPGRRTLLLARMDATLECQDQTYELGTNLWTSGKVSPLGYKLLRSFRTEPVPTWVWGHDAWEFSRQMIMPHGLMADDPAMPPSWVNRVLIQYQYQGNAPANLTLRFLIGDRDFHHQQTAGSDLKFSQIVDERCILLQAHRHDWLGTPWYLQWTQGDYQPAEMWYWGYRYPEETERGLSDQEDLFSPGYLTVCLQPGDTITLEACVGCSPNAQLPLENQTFTDAIQAERERLDHQFSQVLPSGVLPSSECKISPIWHLLIKASDQFVAYRASTRSPTVIAGYHWFSDWGRDTLISLPGLALATHRFELARGLLTTTCHFYKEGLIPNAFPDNGANPLYNGIDVALWWIETLGLYWEATQDWSFLQTHYPVVQNIYKALTAGTIHNIRVDAFDGLITWEAPGMALTWMDTVVEGQPVTPRQGKAIEINALWYSALCWAQQWASSEWMQHNMPDQAASLSKQAQRYAYQAQQVRVSLQKFWNSERGYFYDVIAPDDRPDPTIRPNAVLALSLKHCGFPKPQAQSVLRVARDRLLTPYGLRSLDPQDPRYQGRYTGDIWQRDRTYHQGTVWTWLIGPFMRAWEQYCPHEAVPFDWAPILSHFDQQAGLGSISEIFDGDPPHLPQGAIAQAWTVAEVIRHFPQDQKSD
ncbi:MAG: amylo-alpha-1,6-glucosidase [Elainellaceae cyanobacterium]